jgi:hypothetical protein
MKQSECVSPEKDREDENEKEINDDDVVPYESFLQHLDLIDYEDHDSTVFYKNLQQYSFKVIRNQGLHGCGRNPDVPEIEIENVLEPGLDWVLHDSRTPITRPSVVTVNSTPKWRVSDILKVLLRKRHTAPRPNVFGGNDSSEVSEANGSMERIQDWACVAKLDARQKRSFEVIIASFLLTFHDFQQDDYNEPTLSSSLRSRARNAKKVLQFLRGGKESQ